MATKCVRIKDVLSAQATFICHSKPPLRGVNCSAVKRVS